MTHVLRTYACEKFSELLKLEKSHPIALNMEKSMFNWVIKETKKYKDGLKFIYQFIDVEYQQGILT